MAGQSIEEFLYDNLRKVKPSGESFVLACCPVHKGGQENTPSFSVNIHTGRYHCFSCPVKGDLDDLKRILRKSHVEVDVDAEVVEAVARKESNDDVNEAILEIFKQCPIELLDCGFREDILLKHEIGYDDVYQRTTFPIRDHRGKLVAISGRGPKGCDPRYKVYTHWMLRGAADDNYAPKNKNHLYGLHSIPKGSSPIILVEGYKGCLWVRQAGFPNTVASMGTKVTDTQIDLLRNSTSRVIILFDMDQSGREAGISVQLRLAKRGVPAVNVSYTTDTMKEPSPDDLTIPQVQNLLSTYLPTNQVQSTTNGEMIYA